MSDLNIGGHLSLNGKPRATVEWAAKNGLNSMQIFASSPGAWKPPVYDKARAADFVLARHELGIEPLLVHSIYLINLASSDAGLARRSRDSLIATMRAGAELAAAGVVTHIGSHGGTGYESVADQVARGLIEILEDTPESIVLALENSAGAGGLIGSDIGELGDLIQRTGKHPRLKVVLDTCHLCAAGWDFGETDVALRLVETVEREIGSDRLLAIHANDSKMPCGSHRDRHANIGDGFIGLEGFRTLLLEDALTRVPWILETPDLERRADDVTKLRALRVGRWSSEPVNAP